MDKVYVLTDYHGYYGSKYKSEPYRSGFDLQLFAESFRRLGREIVFVPFYEAIMSDFDWEGKPVLYTSSEEIGYNYKSYIEDVIYSLELRGALTLPRYAYLKANNNKIFMELLRQQLLGEELTGIKSTAYGTLEELLFAIEKGDIQFPCVIKAASGAMSSGVEQAGNPAELIQHAKRLSRTPHYKYEIRDFLRSKRPSLKGYKRESLYQNKFIVQNMIQGLDGDWKILIYSDQYYVLNRHVKPGDFRASGSHYNYKAGRESRIPAQVLDAAMMIFNKLDVPYLSLDMAFDGVRPYLIEFQCLYFGTSTQEVFSSEYFSNCNGEWCLNPKRMGIEELNAYAVCRYLNKALNKS